MATERVLGLERWKKVAAPEDEVRGQHLLSLPCSDTGTDPWGNLTE